MKNGKPSKREVAKLKDAAIVLSKMAREYSDPAMMPDQDTFWTTFAALREIVAVIEVCQRDHPLS